MARHAPMYQQSQNYPAVRDRELLAALWPGGGGAGPAPARVNNTMNVNIPAGWLAVALQAGQGSTVCVWDAPEVVAIAAAPASGQQRWDLVVCQVRDNALDSGANQDFVFQAVTGVPAASSPAIPALPANSAMVALLLITGGQANLNTASFWDRRPLGHAEAYNATAYTIPASSFQTLKLDTLEGGAGFDPVFASYYVPMPGRYLITSVFTLDRVSNPMLQVNKNGAAARRLGAPINGTTAGAPTIGGAAILRCVTGDSLTISVFSSVAANTLADPAYTYAQFQYMGP
jgi:hypothetical protein